MAASDSNAYEGYQREQTPDSLYHGLQNDGCDINDESSGKPGPVLDTQFKPFSVSDPNIQEETQRCTTR